MFVGGSVQYSIMTHYLNDFSWSRLLSELALGMHAPGLVGRSADCGSKIEMQIKFLENHLDQHHLDQPHIIRRGLGQVILCALPVLDLD